MSWVGEGEGRYAVYRGVETEAALALCEGEKGEEEEEEVQGHCGLSAGRSCRGGGRGWA